MQSAAVLVLCAVFFIFAMGITLLGSSVYRNTVSASDENRLYRTALSYLVNQIRRGDQLGGVSIGSFEGVDAVMLTEGGYVTYLYCWGGQLRELYMEKDAGLTAEDGMPVLPVASFTATLEGGLLHLTIADNSGALHSVSFAPRCGVKEASRL